MTAVAPSPPSSASLFADVGEAIERAYAAAGHDVAAFPAIAANALARARLHERAGAGDVVAWLADADALPPQNLASRFGEPPLTVYSAGRWVLEVLFWVEGRTTIHAHDFAGAFTVLEGSSVQRRYAFTPRVSDGARLHVGALAMTDIALLERGAVQEIHAGAALIHSVFHLDRPTVSVVARTEGGVTGSPQYDYWAPSVAIDPEHADPLAVRQQQALAMLLGARHPSAPSFATRAIARADLHATFRLLDFVMGSAREGELLPAMLGAARARHGDAVDDLVAALRQARWEHGVFERRLGVADDEHRFFLGALLTAPRRGDVLRLVAARYPGRDPVALVQRWVAALVGAGSVAGPDALVADACVTIAAGFMQSRAVPEVVAALHAGGRAAQLAAVVGDVAAFCEKVRDGVLRPLFTA